MISAYEQPKFPEKRTRHFSKNLDKRPWETSICKGFRYKSRDDRLNSPKSGKNAKMPLLNELSRSATFAQKWQK